jgi:hypothetical protein
MLKVSLIIVDIDNISGSFSGGYEYYCLLGFYVM